jgi:L-ascorbate metabolism protein UlaG (beta-lactamase superfamily)
MSFELTGRRLERARASKQFHEGRFRNAEIGPVRINTSPHMMRELFFGKNKRIPDTALPVDDPRDAWRKQPDTPLRVTWLGHSSLIIESDGVRLLTDPIFDNRVPPIIGRKRFHPTPVKIDELPQLDVLLLSHDHYDHFSVASMREIAKTGVPIVTSLGVGERLERIGINPSSIVELDWWEEHTLPGGRMKITATPAQHFSGRGLRDRNATLWSSWVLKTANRNVFFSADTGPTTAMRTIGERLGPFDLTMIEIGASNSAWADIHLGPVRAMEAFEMLGRGTFLPIHWGTFDLALHKWDEPPETLLSLAETNGARVITPRIGQAIEPEDVEGPTPWWRSVSRGD